jgi:hypothetical protein
MKHWVKSAKRVWEVQLVRSWIDHLGDWEGANLHWEKFATAWVFKVEVLSTQQHQVAELELHVRTFEVCKPFLTLSCSFEMALRHSHGLLHGRCELYHCRVDPGRNPEGSDAYCRATGHP